MSRHKVSHWLSLSLLSFFLVVLPVSGCMCVCRHIFFCFFGVLYPLSKSEESEEFSV